MGSTGEVPQFLRNELRVLRVARDDQDRVVTSERADHIVEPRSIDRKGEQLRLAGAGPQHDQLLHRRSLLVERMATLLGGRVAETLVFGECSDGAANDLAQVSALARRMVGRFGMSDALGPLTYADDERAGDAGQYSEETARLLDAETRRLVDEAEELARDVLVRARDALDRVAAALLERETLTLADVEAIAGPAPARRG